MVISIYSLPEEGKRWAECKKGDISDCLLFEYEKLFCGVGTFTIELPITTIFRETLDVNSILVTDSGDALIIKNIKTTTDKITLTGYDLNGLLLDRVTLAMDSADGTDPAEGSTEACVKYYVENNFVSAEVSGRNLPRNSSAGTSTSIVRAPDIWGGCMFNDLYILYSCPHLTCDMVFYLDGEYYRYISGTNYYAGFAIKVG